VTSDLRLEDDLSCPAGALIVTGTGITINLNGHTIAGAGTGNGITVTASEGVSIHGGTISGFFVGTFLNVSTGVVIKDMEFTANVTAVPPDSSGLRRVDHRAAEHDTRLHDPADLTEIPSTTNHAVRISSSTTDLFHPAARQHYQGEDYFGSERCGDRLARRASGNLIKGNLLTTTSRIRFMQVTDNTILGNVSSRMSVRFRAVCGNTVNASET
jgi:hypothetical protein